MHGNTSTAIGIVFLILAHLVVIAVISQNLDSHLTGDSARYLKLADNLRESGRFGLDVGHGFESEGWRQPGYPIFLALCSLVHPSLGGVLFAQACLYLITVSALFSVLQRASGIRAGLVFLAISAAYPFVAYSACVLSTEILASFLIVMGFYCFSRQSCLNLAVAGVFLGIAVYVRPNLLLLPIVFSAAVILAKPKAYRNALIILASAFLSVLPWAVRNQIVFGRFSPLPAIQGTGVVLLLGTWEARVSTQSLNAYGNLGLINDELQRSGLPGQIAELNRKVGMPPNTIFTSLENYPKNDAKRRIDVLFSRAAIENMRAWPLDYLRDRFGHLIRVWYPFYLPQNIPTPVRFFIWIITGTVTILGFIGAILFYRGVSDRQMSIAMIGFLLYFEMSLAFFHTEARMTVPARLILLGLAGFAIEDLLGMAQTLLRK